MVRCETIRIRRRKKKDSTSNSFMTTKTNRKRHGYEKHMVALLKQHSDGIGSHDLKIALASELGKRFNYYAFERALRDGVRRGRLLRIDHLYLLPSQLSFPGRVNVDVNGWRLREQ